MLAGAVLVLLGGDDVLDAQVDARHLKAGHRGKALGDTRLDIVEDRGRIGAVLDNDGDVDDHAIVIGDLDRHALGQILGTKLLLHKVHKVTLHAQNVRNLAGGHGNDLLDHTVGIGQRVLGLVRLLVVLILIGLDLDKSLVLERHILGFGDDRLVLLELGIGHIDLRIKSHGSSLCLPRMRQSNTY